MTRTDGVRSLARELAYRFGGWPRRMVAAACLALAALAAVSEHRQKASNHTTVLVAVRDLDAGSTVGNSDIRSARWPVDAAPGSAIRQVSGVVGAVLAAPMTRGEPFTTVRLRGRGLAAGLPAGQVAITVVLADSGGAALVQAGDLVDLLVAAGSAAVEPTTTSARVLARNVRVLAVTPGSPTGAGGSAAAPTSLVVATDPAGSLRIAGAVGAPVLATLRAPP